MNDTIKNIISLIKQLYNLEKGVHLNVIYNTIINNYKDIKKWQDSEINEAFNYMSRDDYL